MQIIGAILLLTLTLATITKYDHKMFMTHVVHAEDDDDEHEDEDEEEHEEDDDDDDEKYKDRVSTSSNSNKSSSKPEEKTETVEEPVYRTITIIEQGYNVDTDGDRLVDALDPDPQIKQSEYFSDDDNDGVPNAVDEHKGEDDFLYKYDSDQNSNGILDSYENL